MAKEILASEGQDTLDTFLRADCTGRNLFKVIEYATAEHAEMFRQCAFDYMETSLTNAVGNGEGLSTQEAWTHRLLLEMVNAVHYVADRNSEATP